VAVSSLDRAAAGFGVSLRCTLPLRIPQPPGRRNISQQGVIIFCYLVFQSVLMFEFLKKIVSYFHSKDIPYMLSGSMAMSVYTLPRATRDFDFVVQLHPKHIADFVHHFSGDYYCDMDAVTDAVSCLSMFNVIDHASGFKADFVILKNEAYRQTEFSRKRKVMMEGIEVYVVSQEDLLISKLIWIQEYQSGIQKDDIIQLWESNEIDKAYILKWVNSLKLNTFDLLV
jgi:hypothetical protein